MTGRRFIVRIGLVAVLVGGGFVAGSRSRGGDASAPLVVDHAYVNPLDYVLEHRLLDGQAEGVNDAAAAADYWCSDHRDVCGGVVVRPEAVYLGLTQDHEETVRMLRKTLDLSHPARLRAFRSPYAFDDLPNANAIRDFVRARFPEKVEDEFDVLARVIPALGRTLVYVKDNDAALAKALKGRYGDRVVWSEMFSPPGPIIPLAAQAPRG